MEESYNLINNKIYFNHYFNNINNIIYIIILIFTIKDKSFYLIIL